MNLPLLLTAGLLLAPAARATDEGTDQGTVRLPAPEWLPSDPALTQAAHAALERGLAYLAARLAESADGSLPVSDGRREDYAPLGVSALGALAFMSAGSAPGRGPFGREVERILEYLLRHTDLSPDSPVYGYISVQGDGLSRMHGHGFATLVLAEAYGMVGGPRLQRALIAAVRRIEASQGSEGGWYYEPRPTAQHEGSVTIALVQALRAARNAGIQVDASVIRRAEDYVRRLQKPDGTFRYQLGREDSSIALTAAAVSTLNMAGRYDDAAVKNGVDAIASGIALAREGGLGRADFPYYERLYLAQALWQLTDTSRFQDWYAQECARIVRTQASDGSWKSPRFGRSYATAVHCLVLSLPEGVLPIFQR